jgi:phosphatidylserine/phosphatidylglycerophosphate/cardiolipin synthase-like enzyme
VKEIRFSPNKDNGKKVAEFISKAKTLDVAIYSLTNPEIAEAIKNVKKSATKVRVICDKQQAQIKNGLCASVGGKIDKKSGLMHNKFIVRDNECVLTGSFNFTNNAIRSNRENFIIICDKETAQAYTNEFEKLWKNNT